MSVRRNAADGGDRYQGFAGSDQLHHRARHLRDELQKVPTANAGYERIIALSA
jgi:hypothetical protein